MSKSSVCACVQCFENLSNITMPITKTTVLPHPLSSSVQLTKPLSKDAQHLPQSYPATGMMPVQISLSLSNHWAGRGHSLSTYVC